MSIYGPLHDSFHVPVVIQAAVLATLLLVAGALLVRRQLAVTGGGVVPDEGVTLRNLARWGVDLSDALPDDPNMEGIDWLPDGRLVIVTDNDFGGLSGPTQILVLRR